MEIDRDVHQTDGRQRKLVINGTVGGDGMSGKQRPPRDLQRRTTPNTRLTASVGRSRRQMN